MKKSTVKKISRVEFYTESAILASKRASCKRARVGCVLVDKRGRIVSHGYNSSLPHTPECLDHDCLIVDGHCIRTLHAEQASILNLPRFYDELICYTTHQPCVNCFKLLVAANVKEIFYLNAYEDAGRDELAKTTKTSMTKLKKKN